MTAPVPTIAENLPYNDAVPGAVLEQVKTGLVVAPDRVVELARYLRDQQGYDYCSMVTPYGVQWISGHNVGAARSTGSCSTRRVSASRSAAVSGSGGGSTRGAPRGGWS